jgi:DNA-binding PadR family transcriptional regulator
MEKLESLLGGLDGSAASVKHNLCMLEGRAFNMAKGVKQEKKYDELKILHEIYRMRGLTITQLCEVFFDSRHYAYKYLSTMKKNELLTDRMDIRQSIRKAKIYTCTDKAIELLEKNGLIDKRRLAKDNAPLTKLRYTVQTNELYSVLTPYGIKVMDSREWKAKWNMDRNTLVRAGITMVDDREIGVYMFFSSEQLSGAGLSDSMLERFKREYKKFSQSNRIAVICYDQNIYKRIIKAVDSDKEMMKRKELMIIPYGKNNFGLNLLLLHRSEVERKYDLETILNARLNKEHPSLDNKNQDFASYIGDHGDKETYVVDFLSMNRPVLHHLETHYHQDAYSKDGKQVEIVCWMPNADELARRFKQYPHVKIVPVAIQEMTEKWLPRYKKEKIQIE